MELLTKNSINSLFNAFLFNYTAESENDFTAEDIKNIFSMDGYSKNEVEMPSNNYTTIENIFQEVTAEPTNHPTKALLMEIFNVSMKISLNPDINNTALSQILNVTNTFYSDYYNPTNPHFWELEGIIQLILSIPEESFSVVLKSDSILLSYKQIIKYVSFDSIPFFDILYQPIQDNTYIHTLQEDLNGTITINSFQINGIEQIPQIPSLEKNDDVNGLIQLLNEKNISKNSFLIGLIVFDVLLLLSVMIAFFIKRKSLFRERNVVIVDATHDNHLVDLEQ